MQDLGAAEFPRHLHSLLTDDGRTRQWLVAAAPEDGSSHALSPSDILTFGVLLARDASRGRGTAAVEVEAALERAVANRALGPIGVHHAARLASEIASELQGTDALPTPHPWLLDAVPALLAALLRSKSRRTWVLAEESVPLLAKFLSSDARSLDNGNTSGEALMPLLESLVRAARESPSSKSMSSTIQRAADGAGEVAAARVLASALASTPDASLVSEQPWRLLLDVAASPSRSDGVDDSLSISALMHTLGASLARVARVDETRRRELCGIIEQKLKGSTRARIDGLNLLRAVLSSPEQPFPRSDVALSVRWALHAVSSAKVASRPIDSGSGLEDFGEDEASFRPHRLVVLSAAVLVAAARYLSTADLLAIRDGWLAPRMEAQALTWRRADGEHPGAPVVCTVRNHVSIPVRERLPLDAVSAIFHADLVLAAYVDPAEFRARVMSGGLELAVAPSPKDGETQAGADAVQQWSYLTGVAVMTILANTLQMCLDADMNRDVVDKGRYEFNLGIPVPDVRRALLHRLSNLMALQRGIRSKDVNGNDASAFAAAVASMPRVQVITLLSAVESVLGEDEVHSALVSKQPQHDVPDVEPAVQAGIMTRAAVSVAVAVGLCKAGRVSTAAFDPSFILRELIERDILRKSLRLAERLAPNVNVGGDMHAIRSQSEKYRMLAERFEAPGGGKNQGERSYGRWADTSASTRASIVAGCFELCSAAAQAPASPELEASVLLALATPSLHLESSDGDAINSDGRLEMLQWVTARASECTALSAATPALSLGATLLLSLPLDTAKACTSMVVTAHASAALWGHAEDRDGADTFTLTEDVAVDISNLSRHLPTWVQAKQFFGELEGYVSDGDSSEHARRSGLLVAAHHLALKFNGTDAAIAVLSDVVHVISSASNPVPSVAAATSASVVLRLIVEHLRRSVASVREETLEMGQKRSSVDAGAILRLGKLIVHTLDAASAIVSKSARAGSSMSKTSLPSQSLLKILQSANAALVSLVSTGIWIPAGGKLRFDDIVRTSYQSSGKLGIAVDNSDKTIMSDSVRREIISMRSNREAMRAATALRCGERLHDDIVTGDDPETRARSRRRRKYGKLHWVDLAAEEPSSEESEEDEMDDDDDDAIFCVRPNGGAGIDGWKLDNGAPFPVVARVPPIMRATKAAVTKHVKGGAGNDAAQDVRNVMSDDPQQGMESEVQVEKAPIRRNVAKKMKKRKKSALDTPLTKSIDVSTMENEDQFLSMLKGLHAKDGQKLRIPTFCGVKLDVFKLFREVSSRGGAAEVTVKRQWFQVAASFGHDLTGQTAASFAIRSKYEKCFPLALERQLLLEKSRDTVESEEENTTPPGGNKTA